MKIKKVLLAGSLLFCCQGFAQENRLKRVNKITAIHHHQSGLGAMLGKTSIYFAGKPVIKMPSPKNGQSHGVVEEVFFVPFGTIEREALSSGVQPKSLKNGYGVRFETTKEGVKVIVSYDAQNVAFNAYTYQSIGGKHGLLFIFADTSILHDMNREHEQILQLASNDVSPSIILDCGHGGADPGALGMSKVYEKDICLVVGLQVAELLKKKGVTVILTRADDATVSLDKRTFLANMQSNPALFVSIHANSAPDEGASGLETFCLNRSLFTHCFSGTTPQMASATEAIIDRKNQRSRLLADELHSSLLAHARQQQQGVVDRRVRAAAAQVLLGTDMPAALVELGFLSNSKEADLLQDESYQQLLAQGIYRGVIAYLDHSVGRSYG